MGADKLLSTGLRSDNRPWAARGRAFHALQAMRRAADESGASSLAPFAPHSKTTRTQGAMRSGRDSRVANKLKSRVVEVCHVLSNSTAPARSCVAEHVARHLHLVREGAAGKRSGKCLAACVPASEYACGSYASVGTTLASLAHHGHMAAPRDVIQPFPLPGLRYAWGSSP